MVLLMSVYKKYADLILSGKKKFDCRTSIPKNIEFPLTVLLYECLGDGGQGKVIGYFVCNEIIGTDAFSFEKRINNNADDERLRQQYSEMSCMPIEELIGYCYGRKLLYMYKIDDVCRFSTPIELSRFGFNTPPKSWRKLNVNLDVEIIN